jgi:hypothetical protein
MVYPSGRVFQLVAVTVLLRICTFLHDLSVHASDLSSSSDHGYFYAICLYSNDDP